MLRVPQLKKLQYDEPYLYEALREIVGAVNSLTRRVGIDPTGPVAPPAAIAKLAVSAADGIFDIAITESSPVTKGISYFVESDTQPSFAAPKVYFLGPSRNFRIQLGNQTLYWRAYSQYFNSMPSPPVAYGNPPLAVAGGGSLAGPPPQPSQGSGTDSSGGGGFGRGGSFRSGNVAIVL